MICDANEVPNAQDKSKTRQESTQEMQVIEPGKTRQIQTGHDTTRHDKTRQGKTRRRRRAKSQMPRAKRQEARNKRQEARGKRQVPMSQRAKEPKRTKSKCKSKMKGKNI